MDFDESIWLNGYVTSQLWVLNQLYEKEGPENDWIRLSSP